MYSAGRLDFKAIMSNKGVIFSLILVPVLNWGPQGSALAADPGAGRLALTDAMLKMMDTMSTIGQRAGTSSGNDFDRTWESMAPSRKTMQSQSSPPPPHSTLRGAPSHRRTDAARKSMSLQGDWSSKSGERLQIRGAHFRLRAGASRELDGTLSIRGHLLALYSPRYNQTWIYEYAEHEGRLALRDAQGQMYLYRRVQSNFYGFPREPRPAATPWATRPRAPRYPVGAFTQ